MLLQQVLNGFSSGIVYALIAAAFSLTFATTRVVNFAFGELFTLGAFTGLVLQQGAHSPYGLALIGTALIMGLAGLGLAGWLFGVLRNEFDRSISTIVIGLILRDAMLIAFGSDTRSYGGVFPAGVLHLPGAVLPYSICILVAVGALLFAGLWWFLSSSRPGLWMQATAQNKTLAGSLGIPIPRVQALAVAVSTGLLGATAVLVGPVWQVHYAMGGMVAVKAFTAALLGGLGDVRGAAIGGLLLGLIETLMAAYVSTAWKDTGVFLSLAVGIILFPQGLFGRGLARVG